MKPDILLLDETEARRIAGLYNLPVTGIIGILLQAKAEGRVASMREEMDGEGGGFWIQDALYRRILTVTGEA
ncbi:DUF3368 domain-containing protein [Methanofollis tationis]|uniref:DUF3368 domain-containing protein n=1 Tax=Methanofollis tationis TaxID=81417 RepID=A0A7K4HM45_9EURY|nr:DUF3368 domain-containing protein [Methanofollis tationis]NVO65958.1 DUF3368 domain-containing protein [Methanofollis tationis]